MKNKAFILILLVSFIYSCNSDKIEAEYLVTDQGTPGEFFDIALSHNNIYVVGVRYIDSIWQGNVLKTDKHFQPVWNKYYSLGNNKNGVLHSVTVRNNEIICAGSINTGAFNDIWLLIINPDGEILKDTSYIIPAVSGETVKVIARGNDIFIFANIYYKHYPPNFVILRLDENLNITKQYINDRRGRININDAIILNNKIYITGKIDSAGNGPDLYFAKFDYDLTPEFFKSIGLMLNDSGDKIAACCDSKIILAGKTQSKGHGLFDMWIIEADTNGNFIDEALWGTAANDWVSALLTRDNEVEVFGISTSNTEKIPHIIFIRYDKNLRLKSAISYTDIKVKNINNVVEAPYGYIGAGYYQSDFAFTKYGWIFKLKR